MLNKIKKFDQFQIYSAKDMGALIMLLVILLVGVGCQIVYPKLIQVYIDQIGQVNCASTMKLLALGLLGIIFFKNVLKVIETNISQIVCWRIVNKLKYKMAQKLLKSKYKTVTQLNVGVLTQTMENDINGLMAYFTNLFLKMLVNLLVIIGIIIMVALNNIYLGAFIAVFLILSTYILKKVNDSATPRWIKQKEAYESFFTFYAEFLEVCTDLNYINEEKYLFKKMDQMVNVLFKNRMSASMMGYHLWVASIFSFSFSTIAVMFVCGILITKGSITLGTAYMLIYYIEILNGPIEALRMQLENIQVSKGSLVRIKEIMSLEEDIKYGTVAFPTEVKKVEMSNVSFAYDETTILNNYSVELKAKDINCIIGASGAGKSTIIKLLARLYDCDSGEILINGIDIKQFSKETLKSNIDYFSQRKRLTSIPLRALLDPTGTHVDSHIVDALKLLGLNNWYASLKNGLDEVVSEMSLELSEGEFQRLYVVKVMLSTKQIILIDELTAHLDEEADQILYEHIEKVKDNKTIVMISHNEQTISHYGNIIKITSNASVDKVGGECAC